MGADIIPVVTSASRLINELMAKPRNLRDINLLIKVRNVKLLK